MSWSQNYAPLGSPLLSAAVSALPVVLLLALLGGFHVRALYAALASLAGALVLAVGVFRMPPALAFASAGFGAAFGLFPIGWIVINAIFIYELSVVTGQFEVVKQHVTSIADDRRIQVLLIAFSFGAFIEGCAGFGAPVAITGALLIGLGFRPLDAAVLALIGNTAPVAFGSVGIPIITLNKVTGLDLHLLSAMVGRQLPIFSLLVPFWLVAVQSGWRGMVEVWPACFVTGFTFAVTQFAVSNYHGPWLVDLAAAILSMLSLVALLRVWRPKASYLDGRAPSRPQLPRAEADGSSTPPPSPTPDASDATERIPPSVALRAWMPWLMLSLFVLVWSFPIVKDTLNGISSPKIPIPLLHNAVVRVPPVVPQPEPEKAEFVFNWLTATGTSLLCAGIAAGLLLGQSLAQLARLYGRTLLRVRTSLATIAAMLALGFTTRYSGSDTTMGIALAHTGWWFPFFSPLIGWLGVALTGSDTSSNVLFGNLQQVTAQQLHLPPILTAAANSSGGVMGKMIDAQSIVVASVATGGHPDSPRAGTILRAVFWHSLAFAVLVGLLVLLQAYAFPQIIP
ncbi:MAG: L-lactate permease [Chthoniobacteraceae bacterium]